MSIGLSVVYTLGLILCLTGLIGSAFSLLQFFSAPLTGAASDYLGRRPVMMMSLVSLWTQLSTGREGSMQLWGSPAHSELSSLLEGLSGPWCYT